MDRITFDDFWKAYGLKRDRKRAMRAWARLSVDDRRAAYDGIAAYREACRASGVAMMYGQGYLNNRRWEDEPCQECALPLACQAQLTKMEEW